MPQKLGWDRPTKLPGIRQDGPERYRVTVTWIDRAGRRKVRKRIARTLADAVAVRDGLRESPEAQPRSRERFADFVQRWLAQHARILAPSSVERYTLDIAHAIHDERGLGPLYVDAIRVEDVREWRSLQQGSASTINTRLRTLRQCLDAAVADGLLSSNPAKAIKPLREGRTQGRRGRSLEPAEFARFVAAARDPANLIQPGQRDGTKTKVAADLARVVVTLAWTGMRKGEVFALKWSDIVDGEIHVERSVWEGHEKLTKTDDPRRVVVVTPLREVIEEHRRWLVATQHPGLESGLVFPASSRQARAGARRRGGEARWWRSKSSVDTPLRRLVAASGVTDISAHSLRRTFEDLGRRAGVDQLVRRAVAGWRTETAQGIYATVDRSEREAAAEAVLQLVAAQGVSVTPAGHPRPKNAETPGRSRSETRRSG